MKLEDLKDGKILEEKVAILNNQNTREHFFEVNAVLKDSTVLVPIVNDEISVIEINGELYIPMFSSPIQVENHYDILKEYHFQEVMVMVIDDTSLDGMILNPFTSSYLVERKFFEYILNIDSIIEDEGYFDPADEALERGAHAYLKNTPEGYQEAEKEYLYAAKLLNGQAFCNLGYLYTLGNLGHADKEKGLEYFQKAAGRNNIEGLMKIGDAYRYGDVYEKNEPRAVGYYYELFNFLMDEGYLDEYPEILLRLGDCMAHGIGITKDLTKAYDYLTTAVKLFKSREEEIFYYKDERIKAERLVQECLENIHHDYEFIKLEDASFRNLLDRIVYIQCPKLVESIGYKYEGVLAYGYINPQYGITFKIMAVGNMNQEEFIYEMVEEDYNIPKYSANELYYLDISYKLDSIELKNFHDIIEEYRTTFGNKDETIEDFRNMLVLDPLRDMNDPDLLRVHLLKDELHDECWMKVAKEDGEFIDGTLLEEPESVTGIHEGDSISVRLFNYEDTGPILVCDLTASEIN